MKHDGYEVFNSIGEVLLFKEYKCSSNYTCTGKNNVALGIENNIENDKNLDFSGLDFSWCEFMNLDLSECVFEGAILRNCRFVNCNLSKVNFSNADLFGADLRNCNLSNANCDGTNFMESILIGAKLEGLVYTERTKYFKQYCPENGYFFGYKKCFNDRMVKLLIPKDAKRCSSTTNACRCDKAKVVAITSPDKKISYKEAISFVDENFVYRLGEYCYADSYNDDRWQDSSHGIHFWMTFEEALGYM